MHTKRRISSTGSHEYVIEVAPIIPPLPGGEQYGAKVIEITDMSSGTKLRDSKPVEYWARTEREAVDKAAAALDRAIESSST